jgi:CheY-like chemotaxis protein
MEIVFVEDDPLQAEWIQEQLQNKYPRATLRRIKTESEFRAKVETLAENPPDIVVMDVMLRWADPSPAMPHVPDDAKVGHHRAGLRCQRLLSSVPATSGIPILLYTVLEDDDLAAEIRDLPQNVVYARKESSPENLYRKIQTLTRQPPR